MVRAIRHIWASAIGLAALIPLSGESCTGVRLISKDGSCVTGRTVEFGLRLEGSCAVIPRDHAFEGTTSQGKGLSYRSQYQAVGLIAFQDPSILDGVNEKGLAVGTFYFPGYASYAEISPQNQAKALSPLQFPNWLLTQFATVEEIKKGLSDVVIAPTINPKWGTTPPPFHYIAYDASGDSVVIEPIQGRLVVTDNPLGVFTNSPTFDWHLTNLRNYASLHPENAPPQNLGGVTLASFGQGSGMWGLPGDFTPPSRFVRAAFMSATALPGQTGEEAMARVFHILNLFDIPLGSVRPGSDENLFEETQFTTVKDGKALKYYFKDYGNQSIRMVDLHQFDPKAKAIKTLTLTLGAQPVEDISAQLR